MRLLNINALLSSFLWLALVACMVAVIFAPSVHAERPADKDHRWVLSDPEKIVWSSKGSADVLQDKSIRLRGSDDWQEFTASFRLPEFAKIKHVRLEVMPSAGLQSRIDKRLVLFDVKPHLESDEDGTTPLEFQSCRFLGNEDDETAANCIDHLSDTGWTVPEFSGENAAHQLVLELAEPIALQGDDMFAITIDSGGASDLQTLSRIRISFSGSQVLADHNHSPAFAAGTQSQSVLEGVSFAFRWCPPGEFLMGSPPGTESQYGDRFIPQHSVKLTQGFWMQATEVTQSQYAAVYGTQSHRSGIAETGIHILLNVLAGTMLFSSARSLPNLIPTMIIDCQQKPSGNTRVVLAKRNAAMVTYWKFHGSS